VQSAGESPQLFYRVGESKSWKVAEEDVMFLRVPVSQDHV